MLTILYDPEWVKATANQMPTGICCGCKKPFLLSDLKDDFCAPCWTGIEKLLGELGDE